MFLFRSRAGRNFKGSDGTKFEKQQEKEKDKVRIVIEVDDKCPKESCLINGHVQLHIQNIKQNSHCQFKSLSMFVEGVVDPDQEESLKYWTVLSQLGLLIPALDIMDFYVSTFLINPDEEKRSRRIPLGCYSFPFKIELDTKTTQNLDRETWTPLTLIVRAKIYETKYGRRKSHKIESRKVLFIQSLLRPCQIRLSNQPLFLIMKKRILPQLHLLKVSLVVPERRWMGGEVLNFDLKIFIHKHQKSVTQMSLSLVQKILIQDKDNSTEIILAQLFWNPNQRPLETCTKIHWPGAFSIPENLNCSVGLPSKLRSTDEVGTENSISYFIRFQIDLDGRPELQGKALIEVDQNLSKN